VLIEAGGRDWNPLIHFPAGFFKMLDHDTDMEVFRAEPDPAPTAAPSSAHAAG
jgi:choline dehydrogenase